MDAPIPAHTTPQTRIVDDKSPICIPFILSFFPTPSSSTDNSTSSFTSTTPTSLPTAAPPSKRPFIIGLNGVQGVGKTTLVNALATSLPLRANLNTLVLSIDDFYLTRADQVALAESHPDNKLVQHRGEPGTHDLELARRVFAALLEGKPTKVPQYNKAKFDGRGDRVDEKSWREVNTPGQPAVQVVILEGWCVGFRAIGDTEVEARWREKSARTLGRHALEHLLFVNDQLRGYDAITNVFDAFIHVDAEDTEYVYAWRHEQEAALRRDNDGRGMTDDEVIDFVDGYYPAYELFLDQLRGGIFPDRPGRQLRLIVDRGRRVRESITI